jgi:very-short-patch-repair endonuclease
MKMVSDPIFEAAYSALMEQQLKMSNGERKRKLQKGLEHAQKLFLLKVWWPAFGHFLNLTPEFEIRDFKDGWRYLDFAWLLAEVKVAIEIDGYGPHWRNTDRWKFADHLNRQNHIILDDWKILRFSYDEIMEHPRRCQQILIQALGKWGKANLSQTHTLIRNPIDRAIISYSRTLSKPFTPIEAASDLGWQNTTVAKHMKELSRLGILLPVSPGKQRIRHYILNPNHAVNE